MTTTLKALQIEQAIWVKHNFGDRRKWNKVKKRDWKRNPNTAHDEEYSDDK